MKTTELECELWNWVFGLYFVHFLIQRGVASNLKHDRKHETSLRQMLQNTFDLNLLAEFFKDICNFRAYNSQTEVFYMEIILFRKPSKRPPSYPIPSFSPNENHFFAICMDIGKAGYSDYSERYLMSFPKHPLHSPHLTKSCSISHLKNIFDTKLLKKKKNQYMQDKYWFGIIIPFQSCSVPFKPPNALSSIGSCFVALGVRLPRYSLHCIGQWRETLLNLSTYEQDPPGTGFFTFGSRYWSHFIQKIQRSYNLEQELGISRVYSQLEGACWAVFLFLCPETTTETEPTSPLSCFSLDSQQRDGMSTAPWTRTLTSTLSISTEAFSAPVFFHSARGPQPHPQNLYRKEGHEFVFHSGSINTWQWLRPMVAISCFNHFILKFILFS